MMIPLESNHWVLLKDTLESYIEYYINYLVIGLFYTTLLMKNNELLVCEVVENCWITQHK